MGSPRAGQHALPEQVVQELWSDLVRVTLGRREVDWKVAGYCVE